MDVVPTKQSIRVSLSEEAQRRECYELLRTGRSSGSMSGAQSTRQRRGSGETGAEPRLGHEGPLNQLRKLVFFQGQWEDIERFYEEKYHIHICDL